MLTVESVACGHGGAEERPLLPESFVVFGTVSAVADVDGGVRTASFHQMRPRIAVQVVQWDGEAAILTGRSQRLDGRPTDAHPGRRFGHPSAN